MVWYFLVQLVFCFAISANIAAEEVDDNHDVSLDLLILMRHVKLLRIVV